LFFRRAEPVEAEAPAESAEAAPATLPEVDDRPAEGRASAPQPRGQTRQSAIFLEERHLDWLEDKCREARQRGGRAIRTAVIIRALLDVAMESPVDLTTLRNEDELIERVRRGLRGG
jgi:hypothetical protein